MTFSVLHSTEVTRGKRKAKQKPEGTGPDGTDVKVSIIIIIDSCFYKQFTFIKFEFILTLQAAYRSFGKYRCAGIIEIVQYDFVIL